MSIKILLLLIISLSLVTCSDKKDISNEKEIGNMCNSDLSANETEIYSMIAEYWLENSNKFNGKTTVIFNKTYSFANDHPNISLENLPKSSILDLKLVEDFQRKNQESVVLNNVLKVSNKYQYLSPEDKFYKDDLTKDFVNTYPNAALLIGFSRIGFNENYSKAYLYSYNLFDRGSYFELERQNCEWKIKQENNFWVH